MTLPEANKLIKEYIKLKEEMSSSPSKKTLNNFLIHERKCLDEFKYIVLMKTAKYKQYPNYDDLNQEGLDALLQALNSFNPDRGNIFWWIHKYVETRILRSARLHSAIKFPLKFSQTITPQRLNKLPILIDTLGTPEKIFENQEALLVVQKTIASLPMNQRKIIRMAFGIDGNHKHSLTGISYKMKMSKMTCEKLLEEAIDIIKEEMY